MNLPSLYIIDEQDNILPNRSWLEVGDHVIYMDRQGKGRHCMAELDLGGTLDLSRKSNWIPLQLLIPRVTHQYHQEVQQKIYHATVVASQITETGAI